MKPIVKPWGFTMDLHGIWERHGFKPSTPPLGGRSETHGPWDSERPSVDFRSAGVALEMFRWAPHEVVVFV